MNINSGITDYARVQIPELKQSHSDLELDYYAALALDKNTRSDAYRLRHLCYYSNGYIDPRPGGEFCDEHDAVSSNTTIVIYNKEQPVASVRVCRADFTAPEPAARNLPLAYVFPDEYDTLMRPGARAVELNRLVRHPGHPQAQGLVFMLFRMADFVIRQHDPDFITSCVRDNHVGFYQRLHFEKIAGPKQYTGLKFMTNFLAGPRRKYDVVRRMIPILHIGPAASKSYEGLLRGDTVPVFDYG